MHYDKEQPLVLFYALGFFLLLTVVAYLLLANTSSPIIPVVSGASYHLPSYQNLFGPE